LIVAESSRFPKLAEIVHRQGATDEALGVIANILLREARADATARRAATFAAQQFLYMVMTIPQRRALGFGAPMKPAECDAWARHAVELFLDGWLSSSGRRRSARRPKT
jgi:AefR-like transcriptional repressor, C-terminal domain